MIKNIQKIRKELEKRGFKEISKEDINSWALVFALEEMTKEIKNFKS